MEDIFVKILSLCSIETLVWIQCDNKNILNTSSSVLRWLLHKNITPIITQFRLIHSLNYLTSLIDEIYVLLPSPMLIGYVILRSTSYIINLSNIVYEMDYTTLSLTGWNKKVWTSI